MAVIREIKATRKFPYLSKRTAVYCRVSSFLTEQLHSMSAQASGLVQMISGRWDMRLVDIYIDFASGEKNDRPEFNRMLSDAADGKLDVIITKSISRFGRDPNETLIALRKLKEHNVQIVFVQENIDTALESSELMISILSAFAEAENRSRSDNQRWGIKKRVQDGTSELYRRVCYGYTRNKNGDIEIDSRKAEIVQMIYDCYLNGLSLLGIQKKLKSEGIPTSSGKEAWSKRAIEKILTNEKYYGDVIVLKTVISADKVHKKVANEYGEKYMISDFFPSIITREIFDAVQEERARRSNVIKDESGSRRKDTHYSEKRDAPERTE